MKSTANQICVNPIAPDPRAIEIAVDVVRNGGVVVFPTAGLYGLGADAFNPQAIERIVQIKGRDRGKPILVLIDQPQMLTQVASAVTPMANFLMERLWPGRVTFVVQARLELPLELTSGTGKIGVRRVAHPVAAALVKTLGSPITGTSANLAGAGGCADIALLDESLKAAVDLMIDAGPLTGGVGSTIVDVSMEAPVILRQGAVPAQEIMDLFQLYREGGTPS
ncbi:MAG: L-threonylcarbamoyladenylate synthase [Desulfobacteraceae bacterium]|nr:L-threonylcarbamoyladenylate synthase [Desulfobacteraceae bacterium]